MPDMLSLLFARAFADLGPDAWDNLDVHYPCVQPDLCATLPFSWVVDFVDAMFIGCEELRPIIIPLPPIPPQTEQEEPQDPPMTRRRLAYVESSTRSNGLRLRKVNTAPGHAIDRAELDSGLVIEIVPNMRRTRPPSPSLSALPPNCSRLIYTPISSKRHAPDEPESDSLPTKRRRLTTTSYMELPSSDELAGSSESAASTLRLDKAMKAIPSVHRTSIYTSKSARLQDLWTRIQKALVDIKHFDSSTAFRNQT